uniref:Fibronectin type-III domain-containing protein n=1 Tax=Spermophilus dauricus TaxID=99837 RepID=A0A8C9PAS8_SPEDA
MVNNTSLIVNKTNDFSSISGTPGAYSVHCAPTTYTADNTSNIYTVENAPRTYTVGNTLSTCTVDSVPCTYTVENTLSTYTVNNTLSTYTVDNAPSTYTVNNALNIYAADNTPSTSTVDNPPNTPNTDRTLSNSSTDHVPNTSTSDSTPCPDNTDSVTSPSGTNYVPVTTTCDRTPKLSTIDSPPSSPISDGTPNTSVLENVLTISVIDNAPSTSTIDIAPSTPTIDSASNTPTIDSASSIPTIDGASNTPTIDGASSTPTIDGASSTPTIDSASSTFTIDSASSTPTIDSASSTPTIDNASGTPTIDNASNTPTIDNALSSSNTARTPSTARALVESNHGKKLNTMRGEDNKQKSGGKENKNQSSNLTMNKHSNVSDIQTRSAVISWHLRGSETCDHTRSPVTFELAISNSGKNGKYKIVYTGNGVIFTLRDLQPSMAYFLRVTTIRGSGHRTVSEVSSFTTPGCEPDPPLAPKLINRSKSSLNLQWKASNDNGSKINSFLLEWDEGKGEDFKCCYVGTMKQYKILKLNASTKYSFRLAAKNNFGTSVFSEIAVFHTSGTMPPTPSPPKLKKAGIYSLSLEWSPPANSNPNDSLTYVLEMEEALGFKPKYNGEDLSYTIRNLQRSTTYKFRMFAYNMEGRSNPSAEVKYTTCPDKPGPPRKPHIRGKIHAHRVKIGWESPKDNGGTNISSYSLEISENSNENLWNTIYTGPTKEFLYDNLKPGTTYKLRVFCTSSVGQSQPSDILTIQTPTLSPASCRHPPLNGKTKSKERNLQSDSPSANGNSEALVHVKKAKGNQDDTKEQPGSEDGCIAVNIVGVGMFGGTGVVTTPATVPAVVPMLHEVENKVPAKLASSCLAIKWEEPDCHGSPITGYNIEYGDRKILNVGRVTECLIKNLQPDTTYKIRIQAINHYGLSPFSQSIRTKTKPLPPEPPHLDCVVYGHQSLKLKWGNTSNKRLLSNLISYNLLMADHSGRFSIIYHGPCQTHKVHRLGEYTQYKFKIQACNEAGEGPLSGAYTFTTTKAPPPTLKAPKLHHQNNNICDIKWESLEPIKGDPIVYSLQLTSEKGTELIYKGPNTSFSFSNFVTNSHYRFRVCAGRQYQNSAGMQEIWGPYSPSTLFSTHKQQQGPGKGGGGKGGNNPSEEKDEKHRIEMSDDTFVLILVIGFALVAILCAVAIQHFLIN